MAGTHELTPALGSAAACRAMGLWRGAPGRHKARAHRTAFVGPPSAPRPVRPRSPLALSEVEQSLVLQALCSERFADTAPAAVHATLLDEGTYLGSVRTMYRLLAANASSAERRRQRSHPAYAKPELLALAPNQVWSWDITKLKGPAKWTCFHLYVILDIFSRYVVGWLIAPRESAELAEQLIADTVSRHDVLPGALTLHADRGTSMRSKPVASAHGMNANVLHRWLKEASQPRVPIDSVAGTRTTAVDIAGQSVPSFIALPLLTKPAEPVEREIKVEVRKGGLVMTVTWPMSAASEFACWSASVLK